MFGITRDRDRTCSRSKLRDSDEVAGPQITFPGLNHFKNAVRRHRGD